jgi:dihydrofolate reductase
MRKIILCLAVSLDGYIEGPNQETDWMVFDEETGIALNKFIQEIDIILYGRVSFERYGNYSPAEDSTSTEKGFYDTVNKMKKYVFTSSKTTFEGNPTVVNENIEQTIQNLKQQPGKNIWLYGGAGLITTFVNLHLIDEFRIAIIPIILGDGNPLFKNIINPSFTITTGLSANMSAISVNIISSRAFKGKRSSFPGVSELVPCNAVINSFFCFIM